MVQVKIAAVNEPRHTAAVSSGLDINGDKIGPLNMLTQFLYCACGVKSGVISVNFVSYVGKLMKQSWHYW